MSEWAPDLAAWAKTVDVAGWLKWLFESNFFAALFGALFGAWSAERISSAKAQREQVKQELRDTNAAISFAYDISNFLISLNKQHVRELVDQFGHQRLAVRAHHHGMLNGTIPQGTVLHIRFVDQVVIEVLRLPYPQLEQLVLEKLSIRGKAPQRVLTLSRSIESLRDTVAKRNALLERYRNGQIPEGEKVRRMYGLPLNDGSLDMVYGDLIVGMGSQTDDCIHFSSRLCEELQDYGNRLRAMQPRALRSGLPKVIGCRYEDAQEFMPYAHEYADWEGAFELRLPTTIGRRVDKFRLGFRRWRRQVKRRVRWT